MRFVIVGAGTIALSLARLLLREKHDVVLVDPDKEKIDALSSEIDCGLIHGDGSKPVVLREIGPERTDMLLCLTSNDQTNILASLVGRSLGYPRVLTRIGDPEFEHICLELGLEETIVPTRAIGRVLFDVAEGRDVLEMTTMLRDVARVFSFVLHIEGTITVDELKLPELSRVICFYRNGQFCIPDDATKLRDDDEVVLITHVDNLKTLHEQWIAPAGSR